MIKETFIALKAIGVSDQHILDVIEAFETQRAEYRGDIRGIRDDMRDIKSDIAVLKWSVGLLYAVILPILFKVFSK